MKIRRGKPEDIPEIRALVKEFFEQTVFANAGIKFSPTTTTNLLYALMGDSGIVAVADDGEKLVGFILVALFPFPYNQKVLVSTELAFYVTPEARGTGAGKQLVSKAEQVAKQKGVALFSMASIASPEAETANRMYNRLGYSESETTFIKVL